MGYIGKNWRGMKNSINLSQKFLGRVKPETALKNKVEDAGKKMEQQILRLEQAHNKLKQNHERIFKKIVEAKLTRNESKARTYATELLEIRKVRDRIGSAKLSMEQIKLRLSTVSELGDIVVTLSPCMSLIKGLAPSISALMPQMHSSMENLTSTLGDMITDSSITNESITPTYQGNEETEAILKDAHDVLEGRTLSSIPEPPITLSENYSTSETTKKKKESMI
jgi:division protein CdvB (Snf7/Vps24/ESCRT-III family)|tara:strand:- start:226 stop:897 length:672 start_codon:yes stop_codon:yes gene_type:complete